MRQAVTNSARNFTDGKDGTTVGLMVERWCVVSYIFNETVFQTSMFK
jgi:hypothetical protein